MDSNIYAKLSRMREAINKEQYSNFAELVEVVRKKAKYYKVLPLYSFLDGVATLTIVDLDEISSSVKFQTPASPAKNAKEHLYSMAFDIEGYIQVISPAQYSRLLEKMTAVKVTEEEIKERYGVDSLAGMTEDVYQRCMAALDKTKK